MNTCKIKSQIWRESFKVHSYEIGPSGFACPQSICRFLQEAASNHASEIGVSGEKLAENEQMWVLSQLSLQMRHYPRWHEVLQIETWTVTKGSNIRGFRDFVLRDDQNQIIGVASTMWLLLDKETKRPLPIPRWLIDIAKPGHSPDFINPVKETEFSGQTVSTQEFIIRASEIDWNMHVNNVCYLEWALELLPAQFRLLNQITDLDISFVAEGIYGSAVTCECFKAENSSEIYLFRISEKSSGKVLCRLRMRWLPKAAI